jgi:hypothetical protein
VQVVTLRSTAAGADRDAGGRGAAGAPAAGVATTASPGQQQQQQTAGGGVQVEVTPVAVLEDLLDACRWVWVWGCGGVWGGGTGAGPQEWMTYTAWRAARLPAWELHARMHRVDNDVKVRCGC